MNGSSKGSKGFAQGLCNINYCSECLHIAIAAAAAAAATTTTTTRRRRRRLLLLYYHRYWFLFCRCAFSATSAATNCGAKVPPCTRDKRQRFLELPEEGFRSMLTSINMHFCCMAISFLRAKEPAVKRQRVDAQMQDFHLMPCNFKGSCRVLRTL